MRKIEDFETFAAGYFLGLGIKKPTADLNFPRKLHSSPMGTRETS